MSPVAEVCILFVNKQYFKRKSTDTDRVATLLVTIKTDSSFKISFLYVASLVSFITIL